MLRGLTSALVEHFNHPQVVRQLALALAACPGKHWLEMLVNDDSGNLLLPVVAREPFVYVRGFRDGLHAYDAEFAARFKLSGLRALPPPVGWPS